MEQVAEESGNPPTTRRRRADVPKVRERHRSSDVMTWPVGTMTITNVVFLRDHSHPSKKEIGKLVPLDGGAWRVYRCDEDTVRAVGVYPNHRSAMLALAN
jgi:hypothetical protein